MLQAIGLYEDSYKYLSPLYCDGSSCNSKIKNESPHYYNYSNVREFQSVYKGGYHSEERQIISWLRQGIWSSGMILA